MGNQPNESPLLDQTRTQIQMVILRPIEDFRLMDKRCRQPVSLIDQAPDSIGVKSVANYQKTVFIKGPPLLGRELHKIQ
jgi:hypothetical protein